MECAVVQVDYAAGLTRVPKMSAWWLSQHFFKPGAPALQKAAPTQTTKLHQRDESDELL